MKHLRAILQFTEVALVLSEKYGTHKQKVSLLYFDLFLCEKCLRGDSSEVVF